MNKLKIMLLGACALILSGASAIADSANFAGPYIGISALSAGLEVDGSGTQSSGTSEAADGNSVRDDVSAGETTGAVGVEAGYVFPIGSGFALDIGASSVSGEGTISAKTNDTDSKGNASFTVQDFVTGYIAPTIVLSDTSSVYIKIGLSEADTDTTGGVTKSAQLSGTTWGFGTRTVLESGIFIRTEAGFTEYNQIAARGTGVAVGDSKVIPTTTVYSAEPTIAYGRVSLGFRF